MMHRQDEMMHRQDNGAGWPIMEVPAAGPSVQQVTMDIAVLITRRVPDVVGAETTASIVVVRAIMNRAG